MNANTAENPKATTGGGKVVSGSDKLRDLIADRHINFHTPYDYAIHLGEALHDVTVQQAEQLGISPLAWASAHRDVEAVRSYLVLGADPWSDDPVCGVSPVSLAAATGAAAVTELIFTFPAQAAAPPARQGGAAGAEAAEATAAPALPPALSPAPPAAARPQAAIGLLPRAKAVRGQQGQVWPQNLEVLKRESKARQNPKALDVGFPDCKLHEESVHVLNEHAPMSVGGFGRLFDADLVIHTHTGALTWVRVVLKEARSCRDAGMLMHEAAIYEHLKGGGEGSERVAEYLGWVARGPKEQQQRTAGSSGEPGTCSTPRGIKPGIVLIKYDGDLSDRLQQATEQTVTDQRRLQLTRQLAEGMRFVHSKGVVHRDLRPDNVLLDQDWNVRICDFGLSQVTRQPTPGEGPGSEALLECDIGAGGYPLWLPPELKSCNTYSNKADVWCWAYITHHVLTKGCAAPSTSAQAQGGLALQLPDKYAQLQGLLLDCGAKDPNDRHNFTAICEKLTSASIGAQVAAQEAGIVTSMLASLPGSGGSGCGGQQTASGPETHSPASGLESQSSGTMLKSPPGAGGCAPSVQLLEEEPPDTPKHAEGQAGLGAFSISESGGMPGHQLDASAQALCNVAGAEEGLVAA